jgi:mRNA interferase MazF
MRSIVIAHLDKARPAVILTRSEVLNVRRSVTIAPITSTIRGLSTEVVLGPANGLDHECVVSCDNIITVPYSQLGDTIGVLFDDQEVALSRAIADAFDLLEVPVTIPAVVRAAD